MVLVEAYTGGDRFATITSSDHGGLVWIISMLCCVYSLLTLTVRWFIKRHTLGADDWVFAGATAVGLAHFIAVFVATSNGLGKQFDLISGGQIQGVGRATLASHVIFILALATSKCSVILLIRRLFSQDMTKFQRACDVLNGVCVVWGIGSSIAVAAGCTPDNINGAEGYCSSLESRWIAVGIIDCITEGLIILLSVSLVWQLQMKFELKVRVVMAFMFRLPLIVIAGIHIAEIQTMVDSAGRGVVAAAPMIVQNIELGYSLVSATLPNLKAFIMAFNTGMGLDLGYTRSDYGYGSQVGTAAQTYKLSQLNAARSKNASKNASMNRSMTRDNEEDMEFANSKLRPEQVKVTTSVSHTRARSASRDEDDDRGETSSQDMIIRRDVQWNIRYD